MADGAINPKTGKGKSKPRGHKPGQRGIRARGKKGAPYPNRGNQPSPPGKT